MPIDDCPNPHEVWISTRPGSFCCCPAARSCSNPDIVSESEEISRETPTMIDIIRKLITVVIRAMGDPTVTGILEYDRCHEGIHTKNMKAFCVYEMPDILTTEQTRTSKYACVKDEHDADRVQA